MDLDIERARFCLPEGNLIVWANLPEIAPCDVCMSFCLHVFILQHSYNYDIHFSHTYDQVYSRLMAI